MKKTGIFGGSFNPIHNGHISLARQLKEKAGLDEVWMMVSPQNPLKQNSNLLDDQIRLKMVQLALEGEEDIIASDYEMHLPKPSYTWNTLQALSKDFPEREFVLMIGGDNWSRFNLWYHHEDILNQYRIVVYPRRGEPIPPHSDDKVTIVEAELLDISSTEIRELIKAGKSIRRFTPKAVTDFIKKEGLYA